MLLFDGCLCKFPLHHFLDEELRIKEPGTAVRSDVIESNEIQLSRRGVVALIH